MVSGLPPPPELSPAIMKETGAETPKTHAFDLSVLERLLNASNDKLEVKKTPS